MTTSDIKLSNYFVKDGALIKVTSLSTTKVNGSINPGDLTPIEITPAVALASGLVLVGGKYECPFAEYLYLAPSLSFLGIGPYIHLPKPTLHELQNIVKSITKQEIAISEESLKDAVFGNDLNPPVPVLDQRTSTTFIVSWPAINHATGYKVSIDDGVNYGEVQEGLSFTKEDAEADTEYKIKVIAIAGEGSTYRDSYPSETLTILTLDPLSAPVPVEGDVFDTKFTVSWPAITNAVGYKVSINNGVSYGDVQEGLSFTKEDAIAETMYPIKVIAVADSESDYEDSPASVVLEVTTIATTKLATPVPVEDSKTSVGFVISWPAVEHATGYKVSIDDGVTYGDTQEGITFTKDDATASTEYKVKVKAIATNGTGYGDSDPSAALTVTTLTPLASPVLTVGVVTATSFALSWLAITNAVGYKVSIDNGETFGETQVGLSFEKNDATASTEYNIVVKAIAEAESIYEDSPVSETLVVETLAE